MPDKICILAKCNAVDIKGRACIPATCGVMDERCEACQKPLIWHKVPCESKKEKK
jgi:hypothetical protein